MADGFSIHLDHITEAVIAAIPAATFKAMEHLHEVAVSKTPLQDGNLRGGSATTNSIDRMGAVVTFLGPYARYQHYELQLRHDVGQALYLEQPLVQETEKILEIVTNELRAVIE